jgi:hypothetical protein
MPWRRSIKQRATITKLIDYAVRIPPEVVLMHYVKPLLLGLIMEKNLKLEDWILIRQLQRSLLHKDAECDPHSNPI